MYDIFMWYNRGIRTFARNVYNFLCIDYLGTDNCTRNVKRFEYQLCSYRDMFYIVNQNLLRYIAILDLLQ